MTTLLNLAARHRFPTMILVYVYSTVMIAAHDRVQEFTFSLYDRFGRERFNFGVTIASCLVAAFIVWRIVVSFRSPRNRAMKALYCFGALVLLVACYNLLFYTNVEAIHFLQYAILAPPLFALTRRFSDTIFYATLIGAADEAYQYFFIYQARYRTHLDFNDMVLNTVGVAAACVLLLLIISPQRLQSDQFTPARPRSMTKSPIFIVTLTIAAVCILLFSAGQMSVHAPADAPAPPLVLSIDGADQPFWKTTPWGKHHHDLTPMEGVCLLAALLLAFTPLDTLMRQELDSPCRISGSTETGTS